MEISHNFVAFSENMNFTKMGDYPDLRLSSIFDSITLSGVGIVKFEVFISVASKKGLGLFWLDSYEREEHALFSNISLRFLNSNLNPNSSDVL